MDEDTADLIIRLCTRAGMIMEDPAPLAIPSARLAIARRLAPRGDCTGIDISEAMVSQARQRAAAEGAHNAQFLAADAQRHSFAVGSFDAIVSRFGVMFFDDPEAAFAKIGNAVSPGGALTCLVWRSPEETAFMTAAERAAGPLLGWNDQHEPDAPGQFAWGDPDRINRILTASGWGGVEISPLDVPCTMAKTDLHTYARRMGRVGMIL
jgi:SAM-dependent methyltransferase